MFLLANIEGNCIRTKDAIDIDKYLHAVVLGLCVWSVQPTTKGRKPLQYIEGVDVGTLIMLLPIYIGVMLPIGATHDGNFYPFGIWTILFCSNHEEG